MDWGFDIPTYYSTLDVSVAPESSAVPTAWLALLPAVLVVAIVVTVLLRAHRRRSFWCALADRDVVVEFRWGHVRSCSAFENPKAIECGRRCTDAAFRGQWPPALPVIMEPGGRRAA